MRFTLSKLLICVAIVAVACAGLMGRTRWWSDTIATTTILLYVAIGLLSFGRDAPTRIFRLSFAVIGGGYLLLIFSTPFEPIRHSLLTDRALGIAAKALQIPLSANDTLTSARERIWRWWRVSVAAEFWWRRNWL